MLLSPLLRSGRSARRGSRHLRKAVERLRIPRSQGQGAQRLRVERFARRVATISLTQLRISGRKFDDAELRETREIPSFVWPRPSQEDKGFYGAESRVVPSREEREKFSERLSFSDYFDCSSLRRIRGFESKACAKSVVVRDADSSKERRTPSENERLAPRDRRSKGSASAKEADVSV